MTLSPAAREWLLALADDELLIGHRHSEWLGLAPFLEEDLAFATIAQDELGHARALYQLLGSMDDLAFRRRPEEYRCAWITELPGHPWESALVRHVLYDTAEEHRWRALLSSTVPGLADLARKALMEEEYHRRHALPIFQRMFIGGEEPRRRIREELDRLLPLALAIFEPVPKEEEALEQGVTRMPSVQLKQAWKDSLDAVLAEVAETVDWPDEAEETGARLGKRSEHFGEALETMTAVYVLDPEARW